VGVGRPPEVGFRDAAPPRLSDHRPGAGADYHREPIPGLDWNAQPGTLATRVEEITQHAALTLSRRVEWGNVVFGFEQRNTYAVQDDRGLVRAVLVEEGSQLASQVKRNLFGSKRALTMALVGRDGRVLLRFRRPFAWLGSRLSVELPHGAVVGEVFRRWRPWERRYDVYHGRTQVAAVSERPVPFRVSSWLSFTPRDEAGRPTGLVSRDFSLVKDLVLSADAGRYAVAFAQPAVPAPPAGPRGWGPASAPAAPPRVPSSGGELVEAGHVPSDEERALMMGMAISADLDFFSRSRGSAGSLALALLSRVLGGGSSADGGEGGGGGPPGAGLDGTSGAGPWRSGVDLGDDSLWRSGMDDEEKGSWWDSSDEEKGSWWDSSDGGDWGGGDD